MSAHIQADVDLAHDTWTVNLWSAREALGNQVNTLNADTVVDDVDVFADAHLDLIFIADTSANLTVEFDVNIEYLNMTMALSPAQIMDVGE